MLLYLCGLHKSLSKMNNRFIKLFTSIALMAVFILQGIWLYNMYSLLEKDLEDKLNKTFYQSIEKEIYIR